jgi:gluconolactonase
MTNGGTGPYNSSLLIINSGRGPLPPTMALVDPIPPYNTTILMDNYYGRQFNSLNDLKVHPNGQIFFTDTVYLYMTFTDLDSWADTTLQIRLSVWLSP